MVIRKIRPPDISDELIEKLTLSEWKIIHEAADGFSSKEIAERLNLSLKTVEVHRHNIMVKLKAKSFLQIVLVLYKKGAIK